jgi:hypothetical protein
MPTRSRRKREQIDEYDLGARFKRWAARAQAQTLAYVKLHPRQIAYSVVGLAALLVTWVAVASYRPAVPPAPRARAMRQMMQAVEEADRRIRTEHADRLGEDPEFRGVFETMRDMPVPLSEKTDGMEN